MTGQDGVPLPAGGDLAGGHPQDALHRTRYVENKNQNNCFPVVSD